MARRNRPRRRGAGHDGFDEAPFPNEPDFHFGLSARNFTSDRKDLDPPATDADGKSTATLNLTELPDLTKPLAATIRVSVFEPSGRAVSESVTRPIRQRPLAIGLRSPAGDEAVPRASRRASMSSRSMRTAKRVAAKGLHWELLRENWQYSWYSVNAAGATACSGAISRSKPARSISAPMRHNVVAKPAGRALPLGGQRSGDGRAIEPALSCRLVVEGALPDVPDKLEAALDKPSYQPADGQLFVKAAFAGEAELAIASDRILTLRSISLPAGGTTIEVPVDAAWGTGVYALVSAYRPQATAAPAPGLAAPRGPGRGGRRRLARHRRQPAHAVGCARRARCVAAARTGEIGIKSPARRQ